MNHGGHLYLKEEEPLNVPITLQSGQTFRWKLNNHQWQGIIQGTEIHLTPKGNTIEYKMYGKNMEETILWNYLGLNHSISSVYKSFSHEKTLLALLKKYRGLRILKQDPWETLASFILSSCTNIPRITKMIHELSHQLGSPFTGAEKKIVYQFPTPSQIMTSSVKVLRKLGLGYRAEYLFSTAKKIVNENLDFALLEKKPYSSILEVLETFPGIGKKIADCVALFGMGKLEAFPIDTHIFKTLVTKYNTVLGASKSTNLSPRVYDQLRQECQNRFGVYAGYAQQYLYVQAREEKKISKSTLDVNPL